MLDFSYVIIISKTIIIFYFDFDIRSVHYFQFPKYVFSWTATFHFFVMRTLLLRETVIDKNKVKNDKCVLTSSNHLK